MDPYGTYSYSVDDGGMIIALMGFMFTWGLVVLAVAIVSMVGMWKVYEKAGKPGWAAIVPIYNYLVLVEIVGRPIWWFFLLFIPGVNAVIYLILLWDLTRSFGKEIGFFFGLAFLSAIFFPILGFGSSRYVGPAGAQPMYTPPTPPTTPTSSGPPYQY